MVSWDFFLPDRSFQRYVKVLDLGIQAQLKPVPKRGLHSHMVFCIYFFSEIIMFVVCCDINLCLECQHLRIAISVDCCRLQPLTITHIKKFLLDHQPIWGDSQKKLRNSLAKWECLALGGENSIIVVCYILCQYTY